MNAKLVNEALKDVLKPKSKKEIAEKAYPIFVKIFHDLFPDKKDDYALEDIAGLPKVSAMFLDNGNHFYLVNYRDKYPKFYMLKKRENKSAGFMLLSKVTSAKEVKKLINIYKDENVSESIESIFKPKSIDDVNSLTMAKHNMSFSQIQNFIKSYYQSLADRDDSIAAQTNLASSTKNRINDYLWQVNNGNWEILYRSNSFSIRNAGGRIIMSNTVQNMDKIYSINGKIGIKAKFEGKHGIIYNFHYSYKLHGGESVIICEFMGQNGENFEGYLEEFEYPAWKGVVGEDLAYLIQIRKSWAKPDELIKPESLI